MSGASVRGAQRVGLLEDLGDVERLAVHWLRSWGRDPVGQGQLSAALGRGLGADRARNAQAVFDDMMEVSRQYGRRALCRHGCNCQCLGADEAVFATLVEAAATGAQEDATLLAALIVRPDMAMCLAGLAAEFGVVLAALTRRVAQKAPVKDTPNAMRPRQPDLAASLCRPQSATVH